MVSSIGNFDLIMGKIIWSFILKLNFSDYPHYSPVYNRCISFRRDIVLCTMFLMRHKAWKAVVFDSDCNFSGWSTFATYCNVECTDTFSKPQRWKWSICYYKWLKIGKPNESGLFCGFLGLKSAHRRNSNYYPDESIEPVSIKK